nr:LysR family transcriptional regulator [Paraburkholderia sp. BL6669N2]
MHVERSIQHSGRYGPTSNNDDVVTVVETEGFASAARKLNVSPSVVSRMAAEFEGRLGVRLLTRTKHIVRLADAGSTYFEDCRRILGEIEAAEVITTGAHAAP